MHVFILLMRVMHILSELVSLYCIHNDYAYLNNVYIIYIHYFRYGNGIEKRNLTRLGGRVQTAFFQYYSSTTAKIL